MEYKLKDVLQDKGYIRGPFGSSLRRNELKSTGIPVYEQQHAIYATREFRYYIDEEKYSQMKRFTVKPNDLIISCSGTIGKVDLISKKDKIGIISQALLILRANTNIVLPEYLLYFFKSDYGYNSITSRSMGSVQVNIAKREVIENIKINIPSIEEQEKIVNILSKIDKKIQLNNQINDNLQEQLRILFNSQFFDRINKNDINDFKQFTLYDVLDVIDNRGKTPELVYKSEYPIIDVRAISGEGRIINYKQCQKYVTKEVYDTFFRSGHPKINDILISTVGSLAEIKIYKENIGTIAQNVVALRSKIDYPMYIYQYLTAIKNDLISYNIGSVQPSIKVTQFMKHNIYIPKSDKLNKFENLAQIYTDKMFRFSKENEILEQLKDTLLPKLINEEISLDKIEI